MRKGYKAVATELAQVIPETELIKTLVLKPKRAFSFKAGQFVELLVPGLGEAPFTPSSSPFHSEQIELTIMRAGRLTRQIHGLEPGAMVGLRGPYGKGYPLEEFSGKELLIVGGGVGLAPLRSLLWSVLERRKEFLKVILVYGAKSPRDLIYRNELESWAKDGLSVHISVDERDESWRGAVGVVTMLLPGIEVDVERAVAVVCGPPVMMKFSTAELLAKGLKPSQIYLSMERNMSCGLGKCGHCRLGNYYVCEDGPVFRYDKVEGISGLWD